MVGKGSKKLSTGCFSLRHIKHWGYNRALFARVFKIVLLYILYVVCFASCKIHCSTTLLFFVV